MRIRYRLRAHAGLLTSGRGLQAPPEEDGGLPTSDLTALWLGQDDADFTFSSGDNIATWAEHDGRGSGNLDYAFVSDTRAVKTLTHPVNGSEETVDTNNQPGDYQLPAGGTLASLLPAGTGTVYGKFYFDRHVDAFSAPDRIFYAGTDLRIAVMDGTQGKLHVWTNAGAQEVFSLDLTEDGWYTFCARIGVGAGALKLKVNAMAEQTAAGAAVVTLTQRPKLFYSPGDAGRLDGAMALMAFYSAVHSDAERDSTMAAIDALVAT